MGYSRQFATFSNMINDRHGDSKVTICITLTPVISQWYHVSRKKSPRRISHYFSQII